jgi:hypothetical protein
MQKPSPRSPRNTSIEHALPPAFRPVFRAYILGYVSSTGPRLLTLILTHLSRRRKNIDEQPDDSFFLSLFRILKGGLEFQRFPTFCAALVGGSTLLQVDTNYLLIYTWRLTLWPVTSKKTAGYFCGETFKGSPVEVGLSNFPRHLISFQVGSR